MVAPSLVGRLLQFQDVRLAETKIYLETFKEHPLIDTLQLKVFHQSPSKLSLQVSYLVSALVKHPSSIMLEMVLVSQQLPVFVTKLYPFLVKDRELFFPDVLSKSQRLSLVVVTIKDTLVLSS